MTKLIRLLLLVAVSAVIGNAYAQCPSGMVSFWKMDDGASTVLLDSKGSINGTYSGILPDQTGVMTGTYAKDFNGASNADIPNNTAFNLTATSSFSIELWIKIGSSSTGSQIMLGKGDGGAKGIWYIGIENGIPFFYCKDANDVVGYVTSSSAISPLIWHYIALVRNETGDLLTIYVDGTQVATATANFTGSLTNSSIMTMGYLISGGNPNYFFDGHLDEVAVYNRALSSTEINTHYVNAAVKGVGYCDALYPVITSTPVIKATVNTPYSYSVKATGAKPMTYTLITKPSGMTINSSGVISWTPTTTNVDGSVSVRVDNGNAPADTQSFRIFIAEAMVCSGSAMLHLKLDETAGTTYADAIAGGHDGAIVSTTAPTPTAAKTGYGGAQLFNATSGIDIPDLGSEFDWANDGSFSVEFWMKSSNVGEMSAVSRYRTDAGAKWIVGTSPAGKAKFELYDNSGVPANYVTLEGTTVVTDGAWHHIVAVRNGTSGITLIYVDGAEDNTVSKTYGNSFSADVPLAVTVGYTKRSPSPEYHFIGSIDEVSVYSRAVTAPEAATYYALPKGHCPEGNYVPVITSTPVTSATEDVAYSCPFTVDDIDVSDVLTLSAVNKPAWATFNWTAGTKTATLTGTPLNANVGSSSVTLRVNDGTINKDQVFTLTVTNVNDAPVISTTPTTTVDEDVAYSYTINVTDDDPGEVITISAPVKPAWLNFTYTAGTKTATLSGTPGNDDTGDNAIELSVTDGDVTVPQAYTLVVNPVNDLPVISAQVDLNVDEDNDITISKSDLTITDIDNPDSDITLTILAGTNYTFSDLTITPDENYNGSISVNVTANDLDGSSLVYPVVITVNPVNDPPVITSTPGLTVDVDNLYVYLLTATDVDAGTTLTLSAEQKPAWLNFSITGAGTAVLTGTPHNADGADHQIILRVSDSDVNIDQDFTLHVNGITAINEVQNGEFVIFPVPVNDVLNIKFNILQEETIVDIISSTGSIIESVMVPANSDMLNINVADFEPGIYFCHVRNNTLNSISRFLVK